MRLLSLFLVVLAALWLVEPLGGIAQGQSGAQLRTPSPDGVTKQTNFAATPRPIELVTLVPGSGERVSVRAASPAVPCTDPLGCPDLVTTGSVLQDWDVVERTFPPGHCAVQEGYAQPGQNLLLRFSYEAANIGPGDLNIGNPAAHPEWFNFVNCHGHAHFNEYADYRLWTPSGYEMWTLLRSSNPNLTASEILASVPSLQSQFVAGRKLGFCAIDIVPVSIPNGPTPGPARHSSCDSNQGISVAWADQYVKTLDGQWFDVTDLAAGTYVIEAETNAERFFQEANYTNNSAAIYVSFNPASRPPTRTPTSGPTATATATPTATRTATAGPSPTATTTPQFSLTPTPTLSPTATPTATRTTTATPAPLVDLVPVGFAVDVVSADQPTGLIVHLVNQGSFGSAGPFVIDIFDGSEPTAPRLVSIPAAGLGVGDLMTAGTSLAPFTLASGVHTLRAVIDAQNTVIETNETNNVITTSFDLPPAPTTTPTRTTTATRTASPTASPVPSSTPTLTATLTSTSAPTSTLTLTSTLTPTPTSTRTALPTATVTTTPTRTTTPTLAAVGGRGLTLRAEPFNLTWSGGLLQTGYLVARWTPLGGTVLLPQPAMLAAAAASFPDAPSVAEPTCYLTLAFGGTPPSTSQFLGVSDFLCVYPEAATGSAPGQLTVALHESTTARLSWTAPGVQDGYLVVATTFDGAAPRVVSLGGAATAITDATGGLPTCYQVRTLSGATTIGASKVACVVPNIAFFTAGVAMPAPSLSARLEPLQAALRRP